MFTPLSPKFEYRAEKVLKPKKGLIAVFSLVLMADWLKRVRCGGPGERVIFSHTSPGDPESNKEIMQWTLRH